MAEVVYDRTQCIPWCLLTGIKHKLLIMSSVYRANWEGRYSPLIHRGAFNKKTPSEIMNSAAARLNKLYLIHQNEIQKLIFTSRLRAPRQKLRNKMFRSALYLLPLLIVHCPYLLPSPFVTFFFINFHRQMSTLQKIHRSNLYTINLFMRSFKS